MRRLTPVYYCGLCDDDHHTARCPKNKRWECIPYIQWTVRRQYKVGRQTRIDLHFRRGEDTTDVTYYRYRNVFLLIDGYQVRPVSCPLCIKVDEVRLELTLPRRGRRAA